MTAGKLAELSVTIKGAPPTAKIRQGFRLGFSRSSRRSVARLIVVAQRLKEQKMA